jgi:hypothetical protein
MSQIEYTIYCNAFHEFTFNKNSIVNRKSCFTMFNDTAAYCRYYAVLLSTRFESCYVILFLLSSYLFRIYMNISLSRISSPRHI